MCPQREKVSSGNLAMPRHTHTHTCTLTFTLPTHLSDLTPHTPHSTHLTPYTPHSTHLCSSLSFSQLPRNVPNWQEWAWSWRETRKCSLNWKAVGICRMTCHTHSRNWVNTGLVSFSSTCVCPHLSRRGGLLSNDDRDDSRDNDDSVMVKTML